MRPHFYQKVFWRWKKKKNRGKEDLFKKSSVASVVLLNKYLVNLKFPETVSRGEGCDIRRAGTVMPQNPYQIWTKNPCQASQNETASLHNCFTEVLGEHQKGGLNPNGLDNQKNLLPTHQYLVATGLTCGDSGWEFSVWSFLWAWTGFFHTQSEATRLRT